MTTLLTYRENIRAFFSRYDYVITPILKFVLAMVMFVTLNRQFGYMALLNRGSLLFLLAVVCAFLPTELITGIGGMMIILQSVQVALDVGLLSLAMIVIFYCGYMRLVPKTGLVALIVPICYVYHLTCAIPIVLGFLVGPSAMVPAIFGIILYYYQGVLSDLVNLLAASTEEDSIQGFQYVLSSLLGNKVMMLTFVVYAFVILVTYVIYRASFEYSWMIAFFAGGFLNVVLFLIGSVTMSVEVEIGSVLMGSLAGILIAFLIQFGKGIVDYQRTELLQFEDDEYYYYVKAIPKLSIAESNKNVKRINSKTHN